MTEYTTMSVCIRYTRCCTKVHKLYIMYEHHTNVFHPILTLFLICDFATTGQFKGYLLFKARSSANQFRKMFLRIHVCDLFLDLPSAAEVKSYKIIQDLFMA